MASALLGPLHATVAGALVGHTVAEAADITGAPLTSVFAAARALLDLQILTRKHHDKTWAVPKGQYSKFCAFMEKNRPEVAGTLERRKTAHQVFEARKRRHARKLPKQRKNAAAGALAWQPGDHFDAKTPSL